MNMFKYDTFMQVCMIMNEYVMLCVCKYDMDMFKYVMLGKFYGCYVWYDVNDVWCMLLDDVM